MATRDELVAAIVERYGRSNRAERGRILNEFVAVTGFHRKHAVPSDLAPIERSALCRELGHDEAITRRAMWLL
jgi:hypothetical protein